MPQHKFTAPFLKTAKPLEGQARTKYFDQNYAGLCLRVGARDKSWCYYYRFDGKKQYVTLGKYAPGQIHHLDLQAARHKAGDIQVLLDKGKNPKTTQPAPKKRPTTKNPNAFKRRVDEFLAYYETSGKKPATLAQARRMLKSPRLESLASTDVSRLERPELVELLESMAEVPVMANRLHAWLDVFFVWCADHGHLTPPWPTYKMKKRFREKPRKRTLNKIEIKAIWHGCLELGYPFGDWCRLLLLTGQRPGECRNLNRNDLTDGIWLVEGGDPKNSETHKLPLPPTAVKIINGAPEQSGLFVFSTTDGELPIGQGGKVTKAIREASGIEEHFQMRDLRRTFNTIASEELGIPDHIIGAVCNHLTRSRPGMARVYNSAEYMKDKRATLKKWNRWLLEVVK